MFTLRSIGGHGQPIWLAPIWDEGQIRTGPTHRPVAIASPMSVIATIMNTATGQPIQKMTFGRMPKPWASFNLETGELVTADRVHVGTPAPGKFITPVEVWVTPKS